ncbi:cytochrome P450 [Mycena epipterygia]|nr:cytochrome P450 [Mycena epipterygia]
MISILLLVVVLLKLALEISKSIRAIFFHPLRNVPGPWYAALSDLWLTTHVFRFQQTEAIHGLLQTYGPVVRIGPKKIAFCDLDTMRDIYLFKKFDKSLLYKNFKVLVANSIYLFTFLDNASQSARKKAFGPHYTAASVARLQPKIKHFTLDLVQSLESIAGTQSVDCLLLLRNFMVDILVFSTFGYTLGAVKKWTINVPDDISVAISDFPKRGMIQSLFPNWAWPILCHIPHKRWMRFVQCNQILNEFVITRVHELQHQMDNDKEFNIPPLVCRLLEVVPIDVVICEAVAHLIAGTETTSTTLCYFLWQISSSPDVMRKLQLEIDNAMPDPGVIPDLSVLQNLPYLNAFISEGFRLHSVVPGLLERVVPPMGEYNLMGHIIPPGTVVATQAWSIHRDPRTFPSPERFDPERWLDDTGNSDTGSTRRAAHMMPFGLGTRVCPGQQLAQAVIRIALAAVVRKFEIQPDSATTESSMKMKAGLLGIPVSGECKLIFIPRTE